MPTKCPSEGNRVPYSSGSGTMLCKVCKPDLDIATLTEEGERMSMPSCAQWSLSANPPTLAQVSRPQVITLVVYETKGSHCKALYNSCPSTTSEPTVSLRSLVRSMKFPASASGPDHAYGSVKIIIKIIVGAFFAEG
jgi:hypothetical protein